MAAHKKPRSVQARKRLTFSYVSAMLSYFPKTGALIWKTRIQKGFCRAGKQAGYLAHGYKQITINDVAYMAHHVAWLLKTKKWPAHHVDHKNLKPADNRWRNLRKCNLSQNKCNQRVSPNNFLGHKGITVRKNRPAKFKVRVTIYKTTHHIGCFRTLKEAKEARRKAAKRLHGVFARD